MSAKANIQKTNYRKWGARTAVALAGIATSYVVTGGWDTEESLMLITAVTAAITSFLVPQPD